MDNNNDVPEATVELIDPTRFIDHPWKNELQLSMQYQPQKAREARENAWKQIPKQILPVIFTPLIIDGEEQLALLNGRGTVDKAIENKVPYVMAIRVNTDGMDAKQIIKMILAPNHSFHSSLLEIGKAASRLHKEYSVGKGNHSVKSEEKGVNPDDIIAGLLGYGLRSSRIKKARLVYEANPDLLKMVDAGELKSLAAAYNTIKHTKPKTPKSYPDGEETTIKGGSNNVVPSGSDGDTTKPAETGTPNTSETEPKIAGKETPIAGNGVPIETNELSKVFVKLPESENWFIIKCPCCNNQIKITTI